MNFIEFAQTFARSPVFSIREIEKNYPAFERENLLNWQKKGHLERLRNGWYCFTGAVKTEREAFFMANKIYAPSYVSMRSAFAFYGWIPEAAFTFESVSTLKTQFFDTPRGRFQYFNLRPALFFGYSILEVGGGLSFKMAEPEKAVLDFLHLRPRTSSEADFEGLRLHLSKMKSDLNPQKLAEYESLFASAALSKRLAVLKKTMDDAQID